MKVKHLLILAVIVVLFNATTFAGTESAYGVRIDAPQDWTYKFAQGSMKYYYPANPYDLEGSICACLAVSRMSHFDYEIDKEIAAIISDGMVSGIIESLSDYSIVSSSHFSDTEKKITGIQTINGKPYKTVFYLFLNENKKDFCSVSYSIEIGYEDYFSGKIEEVVNNAVSVPINTFSTKDGTVTVLGYDYANCYSNDLFLVLCEYDNTSQLNVIPGIAYDVKAFDNNVELDHSFWMPDYPGFSNANKEVLPSGKYKYYEAFKLPESDSVIVEISELLSLSNNKLSLAFELK